MSSYAPDRTDVVDGPGATTGEIPAVAGSRESHGPRPRPAEAGGTGPRRGLRGLINVEGLDLRNTWQVIVGAILLPLGVAAIILGWSGAAHGKVDQQQIPYLISGGVLGLAAVIVGCFFYWAHWLYRIYDQADLHHQEAMREQAELVRGMIEALGRVPAAEAAGAGDARDNGHRAGFVATQSGTNFHVPSCPVIANRQGNVRSISDEEAEQMRPCRICDPLETGG